MLINSLSFACFFESSNHVHDISWIKICLILCQPVFLKVVYAADNSAEDQTLINADSLTKCNVRVWSVTDHERARIRSKIVLIFNQLISEWIRFTNQIKSAWLVPRTAIHSLAFLKITRRQE